MVGGWLQLLTDPFHMMAQRTITTTRAMGWTDLIGVGITARRTAQHDLLKAHPTKVHGSPVRVDQLVAAAAQDANTPAASE